MTHDYIRNCPSFVKLSISALLVCIALLLISCTPTQPSQSGSGDVLPAETPTAQPEPEPTDPPQTDDADSSAVQEGSTQEGDAQELVFQIVPEGTEARFIIQEVLLGSDKTVTGVTPQVSGEIIVVPSDPNLSQIGTITIDARDLKTDSSRRNRSIQRRILLTANDEYQFITFAPTTIDGLPASINVGDTFEFTVTGDLTIVEVTRSETFQMSVTVLSEDELQGFASTTVLHADYELSIPNVPIVAGVEDEVQLELEFTAKASE